jgi:hypothetical protein
MKLLACIALGLSIRLASAASSEPANVFIFPPRDVTSPAQIPRQIARQILLQRLGVDHGSLLDELPEGVEAETAVEYINKFGAKPLGLFAETDTSERTAAVVIIEGVTPADLKKFQKMMGSARNKPAFTIKDAPSSSATRYLLESDLGKGGLNCEAEKAFSHCWTQGVFVGSWDMKKAC